MSSSIALRTSTTNNALEWIRQFDTAFPRFEKIAAKGIYSIVHSEIQLMNPLLKKGREITPLSAGDEVCRLVTSRLTKLDGVVSNAQRKISEKPAQKASDEKLAKKWKELGFPDSVLEYHADCARFMMETKLAFSIAGYRRTRPGGSNDEVKLDADGHPMIKMQGQFVRWEKIARELEYDLPSDKVRSRANPLQIWNYFSPQGLVPLDRFNYDQAYPIYQLTPDEYTRVLQCAKKFYETNTELDPGIPKDCVLQFFTTPRLQGFSNHPLLANFHRNIPVHIGIRLITADRQVYSFGWQVPNEEFDKIFSHPFSTLAKTAVVKVPMLDYEEFRSHEEGRLVTSLPLTAQRLQNILAHVNQLAGKHLRLQYARQNCSVIAGEVLDLAGYPLDMDTTVGETFWGMLPNLNQLPLIGPLVAKTEAVAAQVWAQLPTFVTKALSLAERAILWLPGKVGMFLTNLLVWKMGGSEMTTPLPSGVADEELSNKPGLQTFSRVIRSWTDLFKEQTSLVRHSKNFIDWQKQKGSTVHHPASKFPQLTIVPPQ